MKQIIKYILIISLATFSVSKANATFFFPIGPINDYLRIAKEQLKTLDDQAIFMEKIEEAYAKMEELGILQGEEIDAENKAWANKNVREARRVQEMSRHDQMAKSMPAFMPCGSVTNTILLKYIDSNKNNFIKNKKKDNAKLSKYVDDENNDSVETVNERLTENLKKTISDNPDLFSDSDSDNNDDKAYMADATLLLSSDEKYSTLSQEQQEAMEAFVLLVAPPYQTTKYELSKEDGNKKLTTDRLSKEIKHNMVNQVFNRILAKKIALNGNYPSEMSLRNESIKELYFNPDKAKQSVAYKIQTSQMATPTVVQRNLAVLMSNRVHYSVLQYEEMLKREAILATRLANKINL